MGAIQFVIRSAAGDMQRGAVDFSNQNNGSIVAQGGDVSLNLGRADIRDYVRAGTDLELYLANGQVLVIREFFADDGSGDDTLYLNEDGRLIEVTMGRDGTLGFDEAANWGKWSELDALVFPNDPVIAPYEVAEAAEAAVEQALAGAGSQPEVGTQALGIGLAQMGLSGFGGLGAGAAVLGAGAVAGTALLSGNGGDDGSDGGAMVDPTVDRANASYTIGGNDAQMLRISGTAEPGAIVEVRIGDTVRTVSANENGVWRARFAGDNFPADGDHSVLVAVTNPDGSVVVLDGPSVLIDTVAPDVDAGGNFGMGGDWINAEHADGGITLTGTGEPGAEILVEVEGVTRRTTVGEDGTWSVRFREGGLPGGEYTTEVRVTATDAVGNQTVRKEALAIDTVAPELSVGAVAGDNVVNSSERASGVTISGTSEPGARLEVTVEGVTHTTTADSTGFWSVTFAPEVFAEGEYVTEVTAVATDAAGNRTVTSSALQVDTIGGVTIEPGANGGETVVNEGSADGGIELTGTTEPGSDVTVNYGGQDYDAEVDENGNWTVTVPAEDVPDGEYEVEVIVTATDGSGNTSTTTSSVVIDTETAVSVDPGHAGSDNLIDAAEAGNGVTFSGTTEPGASVEVDFEGTTHATSADETGNWSVDFSPEEIPEGRYDGTLQVTVTDAAGNTASETVTVPVDTTAFVAFADEPVAGDNVVNAVEASGGVVLTGATFPGSSVTISMGGRDYPATVAADGGWSVTIPGGDLPAGETQVTFTATSISAAGNPASSEFVLDIDTVTDVGIDSPVAGDGVVNGADMAGGLVLTGVAEPGAHVMVRVGDAELPAVVAADGSWSATFPSGSVPAGEYDAAVRVTSTDPAGNVATLNETVRIDTETSVSGNYDSFGGDGLVNAAESGGNLLLTGQAEPGASVMVTVAGVSRAAHVGPDGAWAVSWPGSELPTGELDAPITVTATDAAGNTATSTGSVEIDTVVRNFSGPDAPALADGVLAGPELQGGMVLTGTTEPGAAVTVQIAGATRSASVDALGNWSVIIPEGAVPGGEYATMLTTTTIDRAGNVSTRSETVLVDTVAGELALSAAAIEVDDIVNAAERADGVTVTGTATPGMTVTVGFGASTTTALAGANGHWSADFAASDIPQGTWDATVTASITDAYGNTKTVGDMVRVDTEVRDFALSQPVAGDGVISGADAAAGVTLIGSVEPGSVVSVRLGLVTRSATVAADGSWTVDFAPSEIPQGEYPAPITVTATDPAGNTEWISESVEVDTLVSGFRLDAPAGGDGFVNAAEAGTGLTLTGTVEPGASVVVSFAGSARTAVVGADGGWSVSFTPAEVGSGEFTADVVVDATDAVGNTARIETSVEVDTVAPEPAYVASYTRAGDVIRKISVPIDNDVASVTAVAADGSTPDVLYRTDSSLFFPDETDIALGPVSDGTHLVINRADAAGNSSSTLLALDDTATDVVDLANAGFDGLNIDAVDLRIAVNSDLTISADLLESLSVNGNTLMIHGGDDDRIRVDTSDGATFEATGETVTIGADSYNIYTLGEEGGRLIIDDDINIVT